VQFLTEHLASLGAYVVSRDEYLMRLATARDRPVDLLGLDLGPPSGLLAPRAS